MIVFGAILLLTVTVPLTVYYSVKLGVVAYYAGMRVVKKLEKQEEQYHGRAS